MIADEERGSVMQGRPVRSGGEVVGAVEAVHGVLLGSLYRTKRGLRAQASETALARRGRPQRVRGRPQTHA